MLTLNEWQAERGHREWRNLTVQIRPGIYKQQTTLQMNKLNDTIDFVQILVRPQIHDIPHIAEGHPAFLGVCWRAAATVAMHTVTQHLVGLADLELQWSKCTDSC